MSKKANQSSSEWAFTSRARAAYDSDSDSSDANINDDRPGPSEQEDAQLLKDLDLSTRSETVEYKPNPWNIAKINAASRPRRDAFSGPKTNLDDKKMPKKKTAPQGRIVDSFKIQASRPTAASAVLKPGAPIGVAYKRPPPFKPAKIPSSSRSSRQTLMAPFLAPDAPRRSEYASNAADVSHPHSLIHPAPDALTAPSAPLSASKCSPYNAYSPPNYDHAHPNYILPSHNPEPTRKPRLFSQSFSSPPAQTQRHRPKVSQSSPANASRNSFSFKSQPRRVIKNSWKPVREESGVYMRQSMARGTGYMENDGLLNNADDAYAQTVSCPPITLNTQNFESASRSSVDLKMHVEPETRGYSGHCDDYHNLGEVVTRPGSHHSASTASEAFEEDLRFAPRLRDTKFEQKEGINKHFRSPLLPRTQQVAPARQDYTEHPVSPWLLENNIEPAHPAYEGNHHLQLKVSSQRSSHTIPRLQQTQNSSAIDRKRLRSRSPTPSPTAPGTREASPPRKRSSVVSLPPKRPQKPSTTSARDAYSFEPDPDELWSTLPARKKPSGPKKEPGMKASGKFRMPLNLGPGKGGGPGGKTEARDQKIDAFAGKPARRVVTYLPPPLAKPEVKSLPKLVESREEVVYAGGESDDDEPPDDFPGDASELTRVDHMHTSRDGSSRIPSTPPGPQPKRSGESPALDSSPTVVGFNGEVSVKIDEIIERYPQTRAAMRERRRLSSCMWDLLGLDSCEVGSIYRDSESCISGDRVVDDRAESWELPIVMWRGAG
ncbi:hypothetical protein FIBSPDRAFT_954788 [Athelia psychrophila]|uniref:Uncharacterized protein n=1 Tax=Athelia psychrophila TaxID=1759441 RepID=A0A166IU92_9AGAM|nr:hypothetical protein FIBSPDRAFT_954788 [Fibularhizoctonia sp. CBS 109695]